MSKRSRRERREGQLRRALDSNAPETIESLATSHPEKAAQHLARALGNMPVSETSPLDAVAAGVCDRLRRSGSAAAARTLAAAVGHRSPRLRLEHALAAFALGDDAEAERAASADASVAAVIAPLLEAARASTAPAATAALPGAGAAAKKRRRPATAPPPAVEALHRAAAAVKAGSEGALRAGREALRRIPGSHRRVVLYDEISAALDLQCDAGRFLRGAALRLSASQVVQSNPAARDLLMGAVVTADAELAREIGGRLGLDGATLGSLQLRAQAAAGKNGGSAAQAALELARTAGAGAFEERHRGTASLYEGFALLGSDPKRAGRAFDRAVELGGDLLEALRGKLLLALEEGGERCPDCGAHHGARGGAIGAAGDRFARAARHAPLGRPFAAAASLMAARDWDTAKNPKAALASIEAARAAAGGSLSREIELAEARVLARSGPGRADALLDAMLARDPGDSQVWRLKIEIARAARDEERERELLVRAAAATHDRDLVAKARAARLRVGEIAPFEGLSPGSTTAGALAAEAVVFLSAKMPAPGASPDLPAAALACREALAPIARVAFDVAVVAAEMNAGRTADGERRFANAIADWWASPLLLGKLAACAWCLGVEEVHVQVARRLAIRQDAGPALAALFEAAIAADDPEVASELLAIGAVHWSRSEVRERRTELARARRRDARPILLHQPNERLRALSPGAVQREIDAILAPEHRIAAGDLFPDPGEGGFDLDETDLDSPDFGPAGLLNPAFRMLGIDPPKMTAHQMEAVGEAIARIVRGSPSDAKIMQLRQEVRRIMGKK